MLHLLQFLEHLFTTRTDVALDVVLTALTIGAYQFIHSLIQSNSKKDELGAKNDERSDNQMDKLLNFMTERVDAYLVQLNDNIVEARRAAVNSPKEVLAVVVPEFAKLHEHIQQTEENIIAKFDEAAVPPTCPQLNKEATNEEIAACNPAPAPADVDGL